MYLNIRNSIGMTIFFLFSNIWNARLTNFGHCVSKIQFSLVRLSFRLFVHLSIFFFTSFNSMAMNLSAHALSMNFYLHSFEWFFFSRSIENVSNKLKFSNDGAISPVAYLAGERKREKSDYKIYIRMLAFICVAFGITMECLMMSFFVESTFVQTWFAWLCMS